MAGTIDPSKASVVPRYAIMHPRRALVLSVLVTIAAAPGALRLQLRTDGHALIPAGAPEIATDRAIRREFLIRDPVVVLIRTEHAGGIFNAHTLRLVQELTDAFKQLPAVRPEDVFSLATEHGHRVKPGTLHFRRFLDPLPASRHALDTLRRDLRAIELYNGTLISNDERATAILVGMPDGDNRTAFLKAVDAVVSSRRASPERLSVIGAPMAEALLGTHILQDLGVPSAILGARGLAPAAADAESYGPPSQRAQDEEAAAYAVRRWLGRHIGLVPIAIGIMFTVFLVGFRSLPAAALPLAEVAACLMFVFGLMGWLGVPVYLTIAVLPVILTAVGVADEVHIFTRYIEKLREGPGPRRGAVAGRSEHVAALTATMGEMTPPVIKTSVTTAVGFLSFAVSPIGPVRAFGILTAVGVMFCLFWSLTAIPASLALIRPERFAPRLGRRGRAAPPVDAPTGRDTIGRPDDVGGTKRAAGRRAVLVAAIIMVAATPFGIRRIVVQDSWIDGFAARSAFFQATKYFNDHFLGMHTLQLCVDAGCDVLRGRMPADHVAHHTLRWPADLVGDPAQLVGRRVRLERPDAAPPRPATGPRRPEHRSWESWIETAQRDGDDIVATVDRATGSPRVRLRLNDGQIVPYELRREPFVEPETLDRIEAFDRFLDSQRGDAVGGVISTADYIKTTNLMSRGLKPSERRVPERRGRVEWLWKQYRRIRGEARQRQVVNPTFCRSLVTVFLKDANFVDTADLLQKIRAYEQARLKPHGMTVEMAGDVAVSQTLIDAIVRTQTESLLLSLVGIVVVTSLMARSLAWGLCSVIPCALAVLVNFAIMGWVGIPLGVATSMFAGMTLGIGVDYAIHLLERFRYARSRGLHAEGAVHDAVRRTGPAVFIDALAVGAGFGVLTLSQVPANARLGGLLMMSIASCFAATLVLLPALLRTFSTSRT